MSLEIIHLGKLLKLLYLPENRQISELRADIRQDSAREEGLATGGGDFHSPFWADARGHVFQAADLHQATHERIQNNPRRGRLYPALRDGFLVWWNERRRWTNEPFRQISSPHARYQLDVDTTIKLESLIAVRDAGNADHYIYPYFAEYPILGEEAARIALWVLREGLPQLDENDLRILDVIRGRAFSLDRTPFQGDEQQILMRRLQSLRQLRQRLEDEY